MPVYHKVERPFFGGGITRLRGEAVDPDQWRNGRRLVDQRYISAGAIGKEPIACPCGRLWVDRESIADHVCEKPEAITPDPEVVPSSEAKPAKKAV